MTNAVKALLAVFVALVGVMIFFVYTGIKARDNPTPVPTEIVEPTEPMSEADKEMAAQEHINRVFGLGMLFLWFCGTVVYFIPAFIAWGRHHPNAVAIFLLNFLLGWTLIGWVGSLVWSATAVQQRA